MSGLVTNVNSSYFNMSNCKTTKTEVRDKTKSKDFMKTPDLMKTPGSPKIVTKDHLPGMVTPMLLALETPPPLEGNPVFHKCKQSNLPLYPMTCPDASLENPG